MKDVMRWLAVARPLASRSADAAAPFRAVVLVLLALLGGTGCASQRTAHGPPSLAASLSSSGLRRSAELDEGAALLCARDTDAVIDDEVRRVSGIYDGQVRGVLVRGDAAQSRDQLRADVAALGREVAATHIGFAEGLLADGRACLAAVLSRRLVGLRAGLPARLAPGTPLRFEVLRVAARQLELFVERPDGRVARRALAADPPTRVEVPLAAGEGAYRLELIVADAGRDAPEVALLWPLEVAPAARPTGRLPRPRVLFPDAGHGERALAFRLQALIERLRNQMEVRPLFIAPRLERVAAARARALALAGRLGHRVPDGQSAPEQVRAAHPDFAFVDLFELQAQAGTLQQAFDALLDSPAHRHALVQPRVSHLGAAVARGKDALGRPVLSLVVLVAKKVQERARGAWRAELYGRLNLSRHQRGLAPLVARPALDAWAGRLAQAMAARGQVDERALGAPVAQRVLDDDPALRGVRVAVARLDDPLRLSPPDLALAAEADVAGLGFAPGPGGVYLCLLVAEREEADDRSSPDPEYETTHP